MDVARDVVARTRKNRLLRRGAAGVAAALGIAGLCYLKPAPPALNRSQAWIDTVRRGAFRVQLRGAGALQPEDVHWIPAGTDGRIERVVAQAGIAVDASSLLIEISNPELVQSERDAELQLEAAEAEVLEKKTQIEREILTQRATTAGAHGDYEDARVRAAADAELAKAGLLSDIQLRFSLNKETQLGVRVDAEEKRLRLAEDGRAADLAPALARVNQLRALVALRRQQVDSMHVRAGGTGVLQQVAVEVGQRVTAGTELAKVAAPYPLKAVVQVAESQAAQVTVGQQVDVDLHSVTVRGRVARIDPAARNGSVTVDVSLPRDLPNAARPDLSVDALIAVDGADDVLQVGRPVQSEPNGGLVVFRLDPSGKTAVRTKVRVGRASYNTIEILGGLVPGDRVVLSDTSAFDRFQRIRIE